MQSVVKETTRRLKWRMVDRLLVVVHGAGVPGDDEWDALLSTMARQSLPELRVLVLTEGGGPSPAQQARLASTVAPVSRQLRVAVVSDSTGIRFVASTLAFFMKRIRTFTRKDIDQACRYLELRESEQRAALESGALSPGRQTLRLPT